MVDADDIEKRYYQVSLVYDSKAKEGTDKEPIYKMRFKIKLKQLAEVEIDKKNKK